MRNRPSFFYPSPAASNYLSHKGRGGYFSTTSFFSSKVRTHLSPCGRGHHRVAGEGFLSKIRVALPILFSLGIHGAIASLLMPSFQKIPQSEPCTIAVEWERSLQESSQETLLPRYSPNRGSPGKITPHPPQAATSPIKGDVSIPIIHLSSNDKGKKEVLDEGSPLSLWERSRPREGGEGRVRSHHSNSLFTSTAKERGYTHKPTPSKVRDNYREQKRKPYQPLPKYPWICRKRGHIGCVSLAIQTNEEGHVISIRLHKSSGHVSLDQAALNALKTWVFADGGCQKLVSIAFRLKG